MLSFRSRAGSSEWNTTYESADAGTQILMDLAENWAYRLERCDQFKRGGSLKMNQVAVFRIFKRVWKGKNRDMVMEACVQILIDHRWRHADMLEQTLYGIFEFNRPQLQRRSA